MAILHHFQGDAVLLRRSDQPDAPLDLAVVQHEAWGRDLNSGTTRPIVDQYFLWLVSSALGATLSWAVAVNLALFTNFFNRHLFIAAMLGIVAGGLTNFLLARYLVFRRAAKKPA